MKLPVAKKMGSLQWVNKTRGKLRLIDKFEIARQSFIASRLARQKSDKFNKLISYDVNSLKLPDTMAVKSAINLLEKLSSPEIIMHSYRTYYWGALLAKCNKISFDSEQLLVAALAHDLGLSGNIEVVKEDHCFTLTSAKLISKKLTALNYSPEKTHNICEAITRHINPLVPISNGAEAHLLNAGAMLDVIGSRINEIDQTIINDVLILHPRTNFKNNITHCFCQQRKIHPGSRIALLGNNGLNNLITRAPFES